MTADLDEIFSRDPLKLTHEDEAAIIAFYLSQKESFDLQQAEGKKRVTMPKALKGPKAAKEKVALTEELKSLLDFSL